MVDSIFNARKKIFDDLGNECSGSKTSKEAIKLAGLDWNVYQEDVFTYTSKNKKITVPNKFANIRDDNDNVLGIVSERYKIVQNTDAFSFTDSLLDEGLEYETAGSLNGGKRIWLLAKLPEKYKIDEDDVEQYIVFSNSHDGSSSIKIAMTPIRVVCQNTLNLALKKSRRSWSCHHTKNLDVKIEEARQTLKLADKYMQNLKIECEKMATYEISDKKFYDILDRIIPIDEDNISKKMLSNLSEKKNDIIFRYNEAPDLKDKPKTLLRMMNSITDSANHREVKYVRDLNNKFINTIEGDTLIDKAYEVIKEEMI